MRFEFFFLENVKKKNSNNSNGQLNHVDAVI